MSTDKRSGMKVTNVLYWVDNLAKSREFYKQLGFTVKTDDSHYVELELGQFGITLVPAAEAEPEFHHDSRASEKGKGMYLYISVEDVDAKYKELAKADIDATQPKDSEWGNREFVAKDPDGYKVCFWQKIEK